MNFLEELKTDYIRGQLASILKVISEAGADSNHSVEINLKNLDTGYLRANWLQWFEEVLKKQTQEINIEIVFKGFRGSIPEVQTLLSFFSKYTNYRLVTLDLAGCNLHDDQLMPILEAINTPDYLENFYCFDNKLTDACSKRLSEFLEFCPKLKLIDFGYNPNITYQGAKKITDGIDESGAKIEEIKFDGISIAPFESDELNDTIENIKRSMDMSYN